MTTEYARKYYKKYYADNKIKYKLYRIGKYDSLKTYYQEYYQKNKQKIKNTTYENKQKIKNTPNFQKITGSILVKFD